MKERSFDEMIAYFNRRVSEMDIARDYKIELLGMIAALGYKHEKTAQQWIPCSERLPEDDTLMLVNYVDHRPDAMDIWIGWHEMENVWYIDGEAHSEEFGNEVVAWMPLPEPYTERRER